jgi:hypothetical protein
VAAVVKRQSDGDHGVWVVGIDVALMKVSGASVVIEDDGAAELGIVFFSSSPVRSFLSILFWAEVDWGCWFDSWWLQEEVVMWCELILCRGW